MELLDEIKVALRITSDAFNSEVNMLIDAAIADMTRLGIDPTMLSETDMAALPKQAVVAYCKANFGYDNDDAPRFEETYRRTVISLLNSSANTSYETDAS